MSKRYRLNCIFSIFLMSVSFIFIPHFHTTESNMASWWKYVLAGVAGVGIVFIKRCTSGVACRSRAILKGKTVLITGANTGIGKATACELARREARVIMACRDVDRANRAVQDIRNVTKNGQLVVKQVDMASFASIRNFAKEILVEENRLDILINNAGVMSFPFSTTEDGFETQFGVNHLGHFLLTNLLRDILIKSSPSRVIIVSSSLHKRASISRNVLDGTPESVKNIINTSENYNKMQAYANSKLANNLFARELSSELQETGVCVYCVHPGMARTELGRYTPGFRILTLLFSPLYWLLVRSADQAAQTIIYCSVAEELEGKTGRYYGNCAEEQWTPKCTDDVAAKKLWELSKHWTGLS